MLESGRLDVRETSERPNVGGKLRRVLVTLDSEQLGLRALKLLGVLILVPHSLRASEGRGEGD